MYGIGGERRLTEWEAPWLPGYEGSRPVRIGNAAHVQLQLDAYGEVMDALHQARLGGIAASDSGWELQRAMLDHLEKVWQQPDEGIWEVRSGPKHFTYSKVMAWAAFDRAVQERREVQPERPDRSVARAGGKDQGRGMRAGLRRRSRQLRPVLRLEPSRRQFAAFAVRRISAPGRSARARHGDGHRAAADGRWICHALRQRECAGWPAGGRRRLSRLQLLAGRCLCHAGPAKGRTAPVRAITGIAQ